MSKIIYILLLLLPLTLLGQLDSTSVAPSQKSKKNKKKKDPNAPKKWALNGYIKYMPSVYFIHQPQKLMLQNNLIHNRLNFKWYINDNFTFKADLRTRVFFGEYIKTIPNYGDLIQNSNQSSNGYKDYLSWLLLNEKGAIIHSTIDRLYLKYSKGNWDITLGRQRINWGINTIWNPNDIFNTYSFTDFDYEERPGSDALRIQYYTGVTSSIELAVKVFTKWENATAALLWKTNKWEYDFQVLAGIFGQDIVVGGGWAGAIKDIGFKGEFSYFYNFADSTNQRHSFTATVSFDYVFKNKMYLSLGLMYNMNGTTQANASQLFAAQPSAKNLYPYRYSVALSLMYPISETFNAGLTAVYSPGESHALFLSPNFTYSINQSWDIALIGQIVLNTDANKYISPLQVVFLRFKFAF